MSFSLPWSLMNEGRKGNMPMMRNLPHTRILGWRQVINLAQETADLAKSKSPCFLNSCPRSSQKSRGTLQACIRDFRWQVLSKQPTIGGVVLQATSNQPQIPLVNFYLTESGDGDPVKPKPKPKPCPIKGKVSTGELGIVT